MSPASNAKAQINLLVRQARVTQAVLVRSLPDDLSDAQWAFQSLPARSNLFWLVGHIAASLDHNFLKPLGGQSVLPESYRTIFAQGTQPSAVVADYPPRAELAAAANAAYDRFIAHVETLADEDLAKPIPDKNPVMPDATIGDMISLACIHTAYHTGQISMLRRAQGFPTGLGV
jgi:uncharacterized damage-inducible protein DinB